MDFFGYYRLLDPLSVIIKLAILGNKPLGTKLGVKSNIISIQEPGYFQAIIRHLDGLHKMNLRYIYAPIHIASSIYLSPTFVSKHPRLKLLFEHAKLGIKNLMDIYKHCSDPVIQNLRNYDMLITHYLNNTISETIPDVFLIYYTEALMKELNSQWTDEKINDVLDLITCKHCKYGKKLENLMRKVDATTQDVVRSYSRSRIPKGQYMYHKHPYEFSPPTVVHSKVGGIFYAPEYDLNDLYRQVSTNSSCSSGSSFSF